MKTVHGDFRLGDRVRQDHIGEAIICGGRDDDGEFPVAALDRSDYVTAYGTVDEDAELIARAVYMTPERIEALELALSDWEMEIGIDKARVYAELPQRAHSLTGALRDMLAEANA